MSSAGQMPLQRSGNPASPVAVAPVPVAAGTMMPVSATTSDARITRGRRLATLAVVAGLAGLAAGCGDDSSAADTATLDASLAATVEKGLYEKGDTQSVSCESLGTVVVSGVSREVARCSFSEEETGAGEMRARGGCFVLEEGSPLDVTMDVPADVTCFTKT